MNCTAVSVPSGCTGAGWGFESLQQSSIGHGRGEGPSLQDTSMKGCPITQEQSSKESCGNQPSGVVAMSVGGWMHQTNKKDPSISEQCANSLCYRREALFFRAVCQNLIHYHIQTSQLPLMIDIITI